MKQVIIFPEQALNEAEFKQDPNTIMAVMIGQMVMDRLRNGEADRLDRIWNRDFIVNIISKEESGKTADFLFSKPISRFKILTSKILAGVVLIILTNIQIKV